MAFCCADCTYTHHRTLTSSYYFDCYTYFDNQSSFDFHEVICPQQAPAMLPRSDQFLRPPPPLGLEFPPSQPQFVEPPQVAGTQKTVYIISWSSERVYNDPHGMSSLDRVLPPRVPALFTIWCQKWRPPVSEICEMYSGVSPQVQDVILESRTANRHIKYAVTKIINYLNAGYHVAHVQTTCHAGTHRSVATAEIIGQEMRRRVSNVLSSPHKIFPHVLSSQWRPIANCTTVTPRDTTALVNNWRRHTCATSDHFQSGLSRPKIILVSHPRVPGCSYSQTPRSMSLICHGRSGPEHPPHCLTCHPSCDTLVRVRRAVQRCLTCHQELPYDQTRQVAVKASLRAPTRLALGGIKTAAQNYEAARYALIGPYDGAQIVDRRHVHFDIPAFKARKRCLSLCDAGNEERRYHPEAERQTRQRATRHPYNGDDKDHTVYSDFLAHQSRRRITSSGSDRTIYRQPPATQSTLITNPHKPPAHPYNTLPMVPPPPPLTFHPSLPTVYIITYSTTTYPDNISSLLTSQLPPRSPPIPHLYTIDARPFTPPSPSICSFYSGIAPLVQDIVLKDPRATKAVRRAVRDVLQFFYIGDGNGKGNGGDGNGNSNKETGLELALSVCCVFGTHRSVAVAEKIAQGVRGKVGKSGGRIRVVCRHVCRVRGVEDPF
ncbi:hypothetical protein IAQ61_006406, partial [Plenodomus lingam]|uniref:uncharacterized protein n=1 Tax=Leptosphaeria maculans TaxID=5022 RepID=UPI003320A101